MITGNRKDINQQITKLDNNIWELVKNDLKFGCLNFKYRSKETIQTKSSLLISISVNSIFRALLGSVYLRIICDVFYAPLGNVYLRATLKLFYTLLGSVCITPPQLCKACNMSHHAYFLPVSWKHCHVVFNPTSKGVIFS